MSLSIISSSTGTHQQNAPAAVTFCGAVATDRHRHTPLVHSVATVTHSSLTAAEACKHHFAVALWCPNTNMCNPSEFTYLILNREIILLLVEPSNHRYVDIVGSEHCENKGIGGLVLGSPPH